MLARHVAFLTEEIAIRIKNNIVQLVLTSNISRNTLDHTSLWCASSVHEQAPQRCPLPPPPQRKGIRFLFLSWFDPPISLGPRADIPFAPPHPPL